MSNVVRLRPRPPTTTMAVNAIELRLMITALENAEHMLQQHAPAESGASFGVNMLRTRLTIVLAQLDRVGEPDGGPA